MHTINSTRTNLFHYTYLHLIHYFLKKTILMQTEIRRTYAYHPVAPITAIHIYSHFGCEHRRAFFPDHKDIRCVHIFFMLSFRIYQNQNAHITVHTKHTKPQRISAHLLLCLPHPRAKTAGFFLFLFSFSSSSAVMFMCGVSSDTEKMRLPSLWVGGSGIMRSRAQAQNRTCALLRFDIFVRSCVGFIPG